MCRRLLAGLISASMLVSTGNVQPAELPATAALPDFASYIVARADRGGLTSITLDQARDLLKDYDRHCNTYNFCNCVTDCDR